MCFVSAGECESEVCHERGTCLLNKDGYKCQCHPGYMGDQCEFREYFFETPMTFTPRFYYTMLTPTEEVGVGGVSVYVIYRSNCSEYYRYSVVSRLEIRPPPL